MISLSPNVTGATRIGYVGNVLIDQVTDTGEYNNFNQSYTVSNSNLSGNSSPTFYDSDKGVYVNLLRRGGTGTPAIRNGYISISSIDEITGDLVELFNTASDNTNGFATTFTVSKNKKFIISHNQLDDPELGTVVKVVVYRFNSDNLEIENVYTFVPGDEPRPLGPLYGTYDIAKFNVFNEMGDMYIGQDVTSHYVVNFDQDTGEFDWPNFKRVNLFNGRAVDGVTIIKDIIVARHVFSDRIRFSTYKVNELSGNYELSDTEEYSTSINDSVNSTYSYSNLMYSKDGDVYNLYSISRNYAIKFEVDNGGVISSLTNEFIDLPEFIEIDNLASAVNNVVTDISSDGSEIFVTRNISYNTVGELSNINVPVVCVYKKTGATWSVSDEYSTKFIANLVNPTEHLTNDISYLLTTTNFNLVQEIIKRFVSSVFFIE